MTEGLCITTPKLQAATDRPSLFDPIVLGAVQAPNRIIMAPLTRARATQDHVPTDLMAQYYAQRASAGLIISEATGVCRQGLGWPFAPGLYSEAQVDGWRRVTDAVHTAGGRIFAQLWHMGRLAHPSYWGGDRPYSSSATFAPGEAHTYDGKRPYVEAISLAESEIAETVDHFARAAANALRAGFDGIQVHAANGYLVEQFLCDNSNFREDGYGGAIENRTRFLREVVGAICAEIGGERTAVRLSPNGENQGTDDSDQDALYTAAAAALSPMGLAFLELRDVGPHGTMGASNRLQVAPLIRRVYKGPIVLNADYSQATGQYMLDIGLADAISWGRNFISNPDLPERFRTGTALSEPNMETFYTQGADGYTDYPSA